MNESLVLEVCVDSLESAVAAELGGAHRIELCSALSDGGVTPSSGLIAMTRQRVGVPVHVMIRPRSADFCYSDDEFQVMQRDILMAKQLRADAVVFGILDLHGRVDTRRTRVLVELAAPLKVTFHRAFDMSLDLLQSLEDLKTTGVHCVLTSGGKSTAAEGAETLKKLVQAADARVGIMAAGGIEHHNIVELLAHTGVKEVHASLKSAIASPMRYQNHKISMGAARSDEYQRFVVQQEKVRRLLAAARRRGPTSEQTRLKGL